MSYSETVAPSQLVANQNYASHEHLAVAVICKRCAAKSRYQFHSHEGPITGLVGSFVPRSTQMVCGTLRDSAHREGVFVPAARVNLASSGDFRSSRGSSPRGSD